MSYAERLGSFLGLRSVPRVFRAKVLDIDNDPIWIPGMPTVAAHSCPACGKWSAFDVDTKLCQTCHGTLRLMRADGTNRL